MQGKSFEKGEEEMGGDSIETSSAPVRTEGDNSALRDSWQSPRMEGDNQADFLDYVREENMGGDIGGKNKERLKKSSVKSGVLTSNTSHEDTPNSYAEKKTNSHKAKSIYVGQWDSIKEKMVWESMEKDTGQHGTKGVVIGGGHVGQLSKKLGHVDHTARVHVETMGAETVHGPEANTPTCLKRSVRSHEGMSQYGDVVPLTGKRRKASVQGENVPARGKKNRTEEEGLNEKTLGKAVAVKQPRQMQ
jgi:hypothetical protein